MSHYPVSIKVYQADGSYSERQAYSQVKTDNRTTEILVYEPPQNGRRVGRYRLVKWCEAHEAGWEGSGCPLCENDAGKRMRRILAAAEEPPVDHVG